MSKFDQSGGNIIGDIAGLAIPFSLILAKNGIEYLTKKREVSSSKKKVGGACPCNRSKAGGATEMKASLNDLQTSLKGYLGELQNRS